MKKVYIKYNKMYLSGIDVQEEYPENEFISKVDFRAYKDYADTYAEEKAEAIREKLDLIGFELDKTYFEEVIELKDDRK